MVLTMTHRMRTFTIIDGRVETGTCGEPGCVALHLDDSRIHIDIAGNGWYAKADVTVRHETKYDSPRISNR